MFYYPAVLKRHSGCFSTIWLVATKGIKVPRRDFLKVNVINTCEDIMSYVLEQVPPPWPGLPRPRFSLYLSSQLQYGVVLVYHRQCAIFLEEIQFIWSQLMKKRRSQKLDMEASRHPLALPDALALQEETEGAADPLFGVMYMQDTLPSPSRLMEMSREYHRGSSPEDREATRAAAAAAAADITASQESITMREPEPAVFPAPEFEGAELDDHDPEILDMLLAEADDFPEGDLEMPRQRETPGEPQREIERARREREPEGERAMEPSASTIELQPTAVSSEDATLLPPEEADLRAGSPRSPAAFITPVQAPGVPSPPSATEERRRREMSPELEDLSPPEDTRRGRRRRQLIFFDPQTQLSEEVLQQQINNPRFQTRAQFLPLPFPPMVPAVQLLDRPCSFLPEEIQLLWRQAATIKRVPGSDLRVGERGSESSDSERERRMMEEAEKEQERPELDPDQAQRAAAEAEMFDISAQGTLPLEGSDQRELSREISPVVTSDREGSTVSRSASMLQDIPEVPHEVPERTTPSPGLLPELSERDEENVLFHSLLPPEGDRRTVSNIFHKLLESLSARKVRAVQDDPYGDILISSA